MKRPCAQSFCNAKPRDRYDLGGAACPKPRRRATNRSGLCSRGRCDALGRLSHERLGAQDRTRFHAARRAARRRGAAGGEAGEDRLGFRHIPIPRPRARTTAPDCRAPSPAVGVEPALRIALRGRRPDSVRSDGGRAWEGSARRDRCPRAGLVTSLAKPGGNITGVSAAFDDSFAGKWVELLRDIRPVTSIAVVWNPASASAAGRIARGRVRSAMGHLLVTALLFGAGTS
jgi:hypothetical protein